MTDIYKQHDAAFSQVSAFVILQGSEHVATIAFKFPRDGAGRLYAYVHWLGLEMVRGHANGYGYDKRSAACAAAARKAPVMRGKQPGTVPPDAWDYDAFLKALAHDGGQTWDSALRDAGFTVLQGC